MRTLGIAVLLALAVGAGCQPPDARSPSTSPQPTAAIPVDVTEVKFEALDVAVKERKGKVVLIDFWATWCPPCVESFPHFVDAHKKYADKGLVCVSVSMDKLWERGKYSKAKVSQFLVQQGATFPNFVAIDPADEDRISERFGLGRGIPCKVLFDKQGKRVWDSEEEYLSDAALDKRIEAELAK